MVRLLNELNIFPFDLIIFQQSFGYYHVRISWET